MNGQVDGEAGLAKCVPAGYAHPVFAQSFAGFGEPIPLERCGGFLIARPIPGTDVCDAIGCYPLFSCRDFRYLRHDLQDLAP
jgi:hypothetical protein